MAVLTTTEINIVINKALKAFGTSTKNEMLNDIYGIRCSCDPHEAELLWLYAYAMNTWDNTSSDNYLTEAQMLKIVNKVQRHAV
jgi:hypothetical protein